MAKANTPGSVHAYEVCVILNAGLDEKKAGNLLDSYLKIITDESGVIHKTDSWGRRKLAYEINKHNEGLYFIVNFSASAATTDEFARRLGLEENTIRFKVFRNEA
ncbi:MAG: 30S ribosomal protein S6 [Candidatus Ancillula sp.]|jgi:small subunit ribosomal protein S6|nr:30S ribosomal protein S6 [Candidatus Ancillula sp.]